MQLLAILIPYTPERQQLYDRLLSYLVPQCRGHQAIILPSLATRHDKGGLTTGARRNELLDKARHYNASHVAFFDSDDLPGPNYVARNMEGVMRDADVCELYGRIYFHNKPGNVFHHSVVHDHWWQDKKMYYRMPNHLNCIALRHLSDIRFQDKTVGEDFWYSEDIRKTGRLKIEYKIPEVIYHYFNGNKNHNLESKLVRDAGNKL